ncbi:hypothetical protein [Cellulophaga sp. HaHaR_3_176]|nr:hypothetical protein [Cellulophaga sp. HaHaR_3_176]
MQKSVVLFFILIIVIAIATLTEDKSELQNTDYLVSVSEFRD